MKKLTLLIALLLIGLSANALAANPSASATASATAVIVTPIAIAQSGNNLSFGNIVASALGGTVAVDPSGTPTYSGVAAPSGNAGTITAAAFNVTGAPNLTYAITLPGTITINSGGNSMSVGSFVSSPTPTGTLSGAGAQALTVGATLTLGASQAAGTYTGTFSVTVAYN